MIALVEHVEFGPVAIHGRGCRRMAAAKASFRNPRLSLGPIGGGAVHLAEAREDAPLVIAEGIETAASVDARDGLARLGRVQRGRHRAARAAAAAARRDRHYRCRSMI